MNCNFIVKENNHHYHHYNLHLCILIESTTLADGTYELVPASESEQREAQVNLTEVAEDPNPSSEEPQANCSQEGKPRSMNPIFLNLCNLLLYFTCALSL